MLKKAAALCLSSLLLASNLPADEGRVPSGVPHLDHVFVIMMENHAYKQIIDNPNEPFVNQYAKSANLATNYFAVAHPSLTNYLEDLGSGHVPSPVMAFKANDVLQAVARVGSFLNAAEVSERVVLHGVLADNTLRFVGHHRLSLPISAMTSTGAAMPAQPAILTPMTMDPKTD